MTTRRRADALIAITCLIAVALALFGGAAPARARDATGPAGSASASATASAAAPNAAAAPDTTAPRSQGAADRVPVSSDGRAWQRVAVHGLAPLPGGARVPEYDRPPGAAAGDGGPSPVIFPAQKLAIRFNHKRHVRELKLSCTTCHDKAKTSRNSADSLIPRGTRCDGCHSSDHRDPNAVRSDPAELISQCAFCHVGYRADQPNRVERLSIPAPNLKFNHAVHLARNIQCAQCHGNVDALELATRDQLPRMRGCFGCHQMPVPARGQARGECTTCHLSERGGTMIKTQFATGTLAPPRWLHDAGHGPDWLERHKRIAGADSQFCATCHTESYCAECHDGRVRNRKVHPNDWISMHPMAARELNPNCTSCHRLQSFCIGCHQRAGVTLSGPYANFAGRGTFHPSDTHPGTNQRLWTDPPRTSMHHSWEAQRNLNACVSCHVERDCTVCHASARVGGRGFGGGNTIGAGVNPHPPGFRDRCSTALHKNARPCLVCHDPADPQLLECR